jgi:hypothetical protein
MQGIELSRHFYLDIARPWLLSIAPDLRHAAALIGYGSELLGLDDAMSRDHNWGPRVHLFLSRTDFEAYAERLVAEFSAVVPPTFLGEPIGWRNRPHPPATGPQALGILEHGLEVHTLEGTLERLLGLRAGEEMTPLTWLGFAEQRLLAFTAGAVFHDDDGRLTAAREQLAYFPDDIWLYRIACQWRRITEEQAFVGRAGYVGDEIGSRVIAGRLVRDVMRMGFLLDRSYAPYSKWFGSAFARLPSAGELSPILMRVLSAADWKTRESELAAAYLVLARRQLAAGAGRRFEPAVQPYFDRPFMTINADAAIEATTAAIASTHIRALPIVGSLDQVTDLTPLLEDPHRSHAVMDALLRPL